VRSPKNALPPARGGLTTADHGWLARFGFSFEEGGAHLARSMMLADLRALLDQIDDLKATRSEYVNAIVSDNCLGKRSGMARSLAARHLANLYGLDPSVTLFRILRYFWSRDPQGQPLLALICAYCRDPFLRASAPFFLALSEGSSVQRVDVENYIETVFPSRFSQATIKSAAQNVSTTWTDSGHVRGRVKKTRARAIATPGSVAYAVLVGYLTGPRGPALFGTEYAALLDRPGALTTELAQEASRQGWINMKRVGPVVEVTFANLLTAQEMEWTREQGNPTT